MKKFLAVLMSLVMALSFFSLAFAADAQPTSKTEAFIKSMENGVGAKAKMDLGGLKLDGELYIKGDKAAANVNLGPINAKALLDGNKFTAYFGIFSADISALVPGVEKEIKQIVNEVPNAFKKFNTDDVFKYLTVKEAKAVGEDFVESFGPNYEEIAKLIVKENPELNPEEAEDIKAFCEYYAALNAELSNLLNASAEFTYDDENCKTLKKAIVRIPNNRGVLETIDVFTALSNNFGIDIDFITIDVSEKNFKKPFSILNLTWLIKLIIKVA